MESFGRRVAKCRAELGWTQQVLSERLAMSRVAVSHIEADMSWPNERTVVLLAGLFGLEPHELAAGTTYPLAKAQRLPYVTARYTETDHQLALLGVELRWLEACAGTEDPRLLDERRQTLTEWRRRLQQLADGARVGEDRRRLWAALRALPAR
jgi:transcriptional regulator with XRE-family HTH domain